MNLKSLLVGTAIGAIVVGGGVFLYTSFFGNEPQKEDVVSSYLEEKTNIVEEEKQILEIISSKKEYQEEYKTENYEIVIKNTSGKYLKKVEFSLGEGTYELYDMEQDEQYKFVAFNTEESLDLKIISVDYDIINYYPEEISLDITNDGKKVTGYITNNGERDLYPAQIIYFLSDEEGYTIQKTIEYAGCFFEGLVIKSGKTLDFESDIPDNNYFKNSKSVIVRYSDTSFKTIDTRFFSN